MEELSKEFVSNRIRYTQNLRRGDFAIYEVNDNESGLFWGYEVIKIKKQKGGVKRFNGVDVNFTEKELYPSQNEWGLYGFTELHLGEAHKRLNLLESAQTNKLNKEAENAS